MLHGQTSTHLVESIQSEILKIFCDLSQHESAIKHKNACRRKYLARQAIEQRNEKKQLEQNIQDAWQD